MGQQITCHTTDGSVFRYCAVDEERFGPEEMGWILIVEGGPDAIRPHKLSAAEAYGDLVSMQWDAEQAHAALSAFTEIMRGLATERARAGTGEKADAWKRRAAELDAELKELNAVHRGEREVP